MDPQKSAEFPGSKPLPPIGSSTSGSQEADKKSSGTEKSEQSKRADDDRSSTSTTAFDRQGEGSARPNIVRGFRPEKFSDDEMDEDTPRVEKTKRKTYDGREIMFVSLDTQTDWDWVETVETARTLGSETFDKDDKDKPAMSPKSAASKHEASEDKSSADPYQYQMPYNDEYGIPILDLSSDTDDVCDDNNKIDEKIRDFVDEVYSGDSSDDEVSHKKVKDDRKFIPSVGPPNILQTNFERRQSIMNRRRDLLGGSTSSRGFADMPQSENARKLSVLKPRRDLSATYQRESEKHDITADDPQSRIEEDDYEKDDHGVVHGIFSGKCEFCNKKIKPFPTMEQQLQYPPESLYCCSDYREFVEFALSTTNEMEEEVKRKNKLINVKPHEHVGSKQERNAAKEKAVQRMRERELQRRQQEASGLQQNFFASGGARAVPHRNPGGIGSLTMKDMFVARQMKTINYQLSSQKCLEEGWTLRAPSPLIDELGDDVFIPEPLHPDMLEDGRDKPLAYRPDSAALLKLLRERPLIEKFYETGQKFLTMFPDGTGNVFYPSGHLAILISAVKLGQYFYTIHNDMKRSDVVAAFEPNGFGYCYFPNGAVRMYIDQYGGIELDASGGKKRKWSWKDQVTHIHAPPFQPICIGLNRHMGVRVMSQENIALTFSASQRSCRFNMGARLKIVAPENVPLKEIEENYIYLEEKKNQVDAILDKVSNLLKFPNHPKLEKMLPPLHISSKATKNEKLKKDRQTFLAQQSARDKKQAPVAVN